MVIQDRSSCTTTQHLIIQDTSFTIEQLELVELLDVQGFPRLELVNSYWSRTGDVAKPFGTLNGAAANHLLYIPNRSCCKTIWNPERSCCKPLISLQELLQNHFDLWTGAASKPFSFRKGAAPNTFSSLMDAVAKPFWSQTGAFAKPFWSLRARAVAKLFDLEL
jgi:hypothetical protein